MIIDEEENNSVNIITISGNSEKCEKAKVLLMVMFKYLIVII